nr:EOG090X07SL [Eulimnadia texana]
MSRDAVTVSAARFEEFDFEPWTFKTSKSHILPSKCIANPNCDLTTDGEAEKCCSVCRYSSQLTLPHLPDMVFSENYLKIIHPKGFGIEFNALDALKRVNDREDSVKVAVSEAWQEARADLLTQHEVSHPFDWTFTTDYRGTVFGDGLTVNETDLRIDLEKLKKKENILFYDELHLYEDELADHGCTSCSVKRVMPSGFFILHRLYLRVDDVIIRINDTRLHFEVGKNYILREYSSRESKAKDLKVPRVFWGDPNEIWHHLPLKNAVYEKLEF